VADIFGLNADKNCVEIFFNLHLIGFF